MAEEMSAQAESLQQLMSFFKLGNESGNVARRKSVFDHQPAVHYAQARVFGHDPAKETGGNGHGVGMQRSAGSNPADFKRFE